MRSSFDGSCRGELSLRTVNAGCLWLLTLNAADANGRRDLPMSDAHVEYETGVIANSRIAMLGLIYFKLPEMAWAEFLRDAIVQDYLVDTFRWTGDHPRWEESWSYRKSAGVEDICSAKRLVRFSVDCRVMMHLWDCWTAIVNTFVKGDTVRLQWCYQRVLMRRMIWASVCRCETRVKFYQCTKTSILSRAFLFT